MCSVWLQKCNQRTIPVRFYENLRLTVAFLSKENQWEIL
jgi:hypothetical protein